MAVECGALLTSLLPVCYVTSSTAATPPSIISYDLLAVQQLVHSEELPQAVRVPQLRDNVKPAQEQFQSRPSHIHKGGVETSPTPLILRKEGKYSSRPLPAELQLEVYKFGVSAEGHQSQGRDRRPASVATDDRYNHHVYRQPPSSSPPSSTASPTAPPPLSRRSSGFANVTWDATYSGRRGRGRCEDGAGGGGVDG